MALERENGGFRLGGVNPRGFRLRQELGFVRLVGKSGGGQGLELLG